MTGYGQGVAEADGVRVSIEMRSVNHRFRDVKLRGSGLTAALEDELSRKVHKRVERGSVTVTVRAKMDSSLALKVDATVARRVYNQLQELALMLGIDSEIGLPLISAQPGVLVAGEADDQSDIGPVAHQALESALLALETMRETEGASLRDDLVSRFSRLQALVEEISSLAESAPDDARKRMEERISRLLANSSIAVDDARIAHEVAILADKFDITEEVVRLRSHFDQLEGIVNERGPVGRRIGFLVQEVGRELNTVGSKTQVVDIAPLLIAAKAELEKVREQIQNIE